MDEAWDRIEAWLAANAPRVLESLQPGATDAQIAEAEAALSVRLPDEFKASCRRHDGQGDERAGFVLGWELLSLARIGEVWAFWKDLLDGGGFADSVAEGGPGVRADWWNARWVPLTCSGSSNYNCLDLDPAPGGRAGQVISVWHDDGDRDALAPSFRVWLEDFAGALESGGYVVEDGCLRLA